MNQARRSTGRGQRGSKYVFGESIAALPMLTCESMNANMCVAVSREREPRVRVLFLSRGATGGCDLPAYSGRGVRPFQTGLTTGHLLINIYQDCKDALLRHGSIGAPEESIHFFLARARATRLYVLVPRRRCRVRLTSDRLAGRHVTRGAFASYYRLRSARRSAYCIISRHAQVRRASGFSPP